MNTQGNGLSFIIVLPSRRSCLEIFILVLGVLAMFASGYAETRTSGDADCDHSELRTALENRAYGVASELIFQTHYPDCIDPEGDTLLTVLARFDADGGRLISEAIRTGADINANDANSRTAIERAASNGRMENVRILLAAGAEVRRAKDIARSNGYFEIEELFEAPDIVERELLDERLRDAARDGDTELVEGLLLSGARIESLGYGRNSALNWAAQNGYEETVRLLLEYGADPNVSGIPSNIVRDNHIGIVKLLLASGADIDRQDPAGRTPLMVAAESGDFEMVTFLLGEGADPGIENREGHTALMFAKNQHHDAIVDRLRSAGAKSGTGRRMDSPLFGERDPERVRRLIAMGADVNARDSIGRTILGASFQYRDHTIARILIEAGADVNDSGGQLFPASPLIHAVMSLASQDEILKTVTLFLEHGVEVDQPRSQDGATAIIVAAQRRYRDIVRLLLSHGADPDYRDRRGYSARDFIEIEETNAPGSE